MVYEGGVLGQRHGGYPRLYTPPSPLGVYNADMNLVDDIQKADYDLALFSVFETFARPFQLYIQAQTAVISTSPLFSRFGEHDQNAAITTENLPVTPQVYTVSGCILYGNKQPWEYIAPVDVQNKIRESAGIVRIKVYPQGYDLMKSCKLVNLDGFDFTLNSNARPHGLVGNPNRYTFTLLKTD